MGELRIKGNILVFFRKGKLQNIKELQSYRCNTYYFQQLTINSAVCPVLEVECFLLESAFQDHFKIKLLAAISGSQRLSLQRKISFQRLLVCFEMSKH